MWGGMARVRPRGCVVRVSGAGEVWLGFGGGVVFQKVFFQVDLFVGDFFWMGII